MHRFSKWFSPSGFPIKRPYFPLLSRLLATWPVHLILRDLITPVKFGGECMSQSSSLCNLPYCPVTLSILGPDTFVSTLFFNTLSLRPSLKARDCILHPYRMRQNLILYILMFKFFGNELEDKRCRTAK
jgi:hypothetical protein